MKFVEKFQRQLLLHGYNPGKPDGDFGPKTYRAAMDALKAAGKPQVTEPAILPSHKRNYTPWLKEARRLEGVTEIKGKRHNKTIMGWAEKLSIWYRDDETPWCGLFTAHCIGSQLPNEVIPKNPLGARNWLKFGKKINEPVEGAIAVFWRGKKSGWQGHVGFVVGSNATHLFILGGNQSNQVNIRKFSKSRLLGYRWPKTAPVFGNNVAMSGGQSTDGNEQ